MKYYNETVSGVGTVIDYIDYLVELNSIVGTDHSSSEILSPSSTTQ
jgi:hypothetical protein